MFLPPIAQPIVYLPARLYEWAVRGRIALYRRGVFATRRLGAPVISVGNLTVGGTGKTPCVAFLARLLGEEGLAVAILSRGYRRASRGRVEVSDGREIRCSPAEAGDEPYLLARSCPGARVIVDSDRYAAGRWLEERARVSVFLLDDGFQHLRLGRDLNLLLWDGTDRPAEARMVPFGRLREPLGGFARADAVIVTRTDERTDRAAIQAAVARYGRPGTPVFFAAHDVTSLVRLPGGEPLASDALAGRPVAAFSGIARPDRFHQDLAQRGMRVRLRRDFEDHHRYSPEELRALVRDAASAGADALVTTEKDAANLPQEALADLPLPLHAARIAFRVENEAELRRLLLATARNVIHL
ncbi:MAG: tetraacyldisaccharide 4'-kinase [Blastocatellia bacterium]|nr:tetraacyldisaccharide 4'-kinase [Blastocatellia bacterium]